MASRRASLPPPAAPRPAIDLEITVISGKHLKNVNWRNGDLKPYAVVYIDPDRRAATKPDDDGGIKPVWNEKLPPFPLPDCRTNNNSLDFSQIYLTIDVFHSKPSETPKPLVGSVRASLGHLLQGHYPTSPLPIKTLDLRRPTGRPHGIIRIKVALKERASRTLPPPPLSEHNFQNASPPSGYNYYSAASEPPPPPPPAMHEYSRYSPALPPPSYVVPYSYSSYLDSNMGSAYHSSQAYYSAPPVPAMAPPPPRTYYDRVPSAGYGGPSAPAEYPSGSLSFYEQKPKGSKAGFGTGLAVGAVAGALGGLALDEAVKYEENIAERMENDVAARNDYADYRDDY